MHMARLELRIKAKIMIGWVTYQLEYHLICESKFNTRLALEHLLLNGCRQVAPHLIFPNG
jgi:hypothetical protein